MHLEVDLYWAWRGAADPVDLIHRHRGRIKQVHVKDLDVSTGSFADPGRHGLIDFGRIFRARPGGRPGRVHRGARRRGQPAAHPGDRPWTPREIGYDFLAGLRF